MKTKWHGAVLELIICNRPFVSPQLLAGCDALLPLHGGWNYTGNFCFKAFVDEMQEWKARVDCIKTTSHFTYKKLWYKRIFMAHSRVATKKQATLAGKKRKKIHS